jgi:predicted transcriptional regulator of viral defense system
MAQKKQTAENKLYSIAAGQMGFFTARQAVEAGFQDPNHSFHVKNGNWEKIRRGIYRLSRYPRTPEAEFVVYSLWSRNKEGIPQGVYSHETALSINELSDANPAKLHMTVPPGFRRNSKIPKMLNLHKNILAPGDIAEYSGYSVTRPVRTVRDILASASANPEIIEQALADGLKTGTITMEEMKTLYKSFPAQKHLFPKSVKKSK